jgi:hypothetical protein
MNQDDVTLAINLVATAEAAKLIANAPLPNFLRRNGLALYLRISEVGIALEYGMPCKHVHELLQSAIELKPEPHEEKEG